MRNSDVRGTKSGILEKTDQIARVECAVGVGAGKPPLLHRLPRSRVDHKAAAGSQYAVGFRNIPALRIEEIDDVDQQRLVEHLVDPGQPAERSLHQHHSPSGYRYLVHEI